MTRNERLQRKRLVIAVIVVLTMMLASVSNLVIVLCRQMRGNCVQKSVVEYHEDGRHIDVDYPAVEIDPMEEDPLESVKIEQAVIGTIGTDREVECWGYSITEVAKAIYAEAGANSEELQRAILTCIFNTQKNSGWRMTPQDVIESYGYAHSDTYSDEVMEVCIDVLLRGHLDADIVEQDATLFHSLGKGGNPHLHDNEKYCEWVAEIDGVQFYREKGQG